MARTNDCVRVLESIVWIFVFNRAMKVISMILQKPNLFVISYDS